MTTINSAPSLQVQSDDRWIVFLDGIIVNGQNVSGNSALYVKQLLLQINIDVSSLVTCQVKAPVKHLRI